MLQSNTYQEAEVSVYLWFNWWSSFFPSVASGPNSGAQMLAVPATDITPGASPRKKPRKQQHVISTEESEMMETNSTDEEKFPHKPLSQRAEKRKSPPKEYIGKLYYYEAVS